MNAFANLVDQLKPDTLACLQAVCLRNHSLSEIEASARTGPMEPHLKRLTDLGLMVADQAGKYWYPSFDGRGVAHWDSQKRSFPAPILSRVWARMAISSQISLVTSIAPSSTLQAIAGVGIFGQSM